MASKVPDQEDRNQEVIEMKRIYLDSIGDHHSLWDPLRKNPPEGFKVITGTDSVDSVWSSLKKRDRLPTWGYRLSRHILPPKLLVGLKRSISRPEVARDLTLTTGHLLVTNEPWILEIEAPHHPVSYSRFQLQLLKGFIRRVLQDDACRGIICWTEACASAMDSVFQNQEISQKTHVVRLAPDQELSSINLRESPSNDPTLLFVGSSNIPGQFEPKGGREVIAAHKFLSSKYEDLRLIIRSDVPKDVRRECANLPRVELYEDRVEWEKMKELFNRSDIFVFPSYATPARVFLDAMCFGLPIITTDVWANSEMVRDGHNGRLIQPSDRMEYKDSDGVPLFRAKGSAWRNRALSEADEDLVQRVAREVDDLLGSPEVRRELGENGKKMVTNGEFSPAVRDTRLSEVLNEAS